MRCVEILLGKKKNDYKIMNNKGLNKTQWWKRFIYYHGFIKFYANLSQFPIVQFYKYMYQYKKTLFYLTLFSNYGLPILIELLPWYLNRGKLSSYLRKTRNNINHRMISGQSFLLSNLFKWLCYSIFYTILVTGENMLQSRVNLANRLVIKRLIICGFVL